MRVLTLCSMAMAGGNAGDALDRRLGHSPEELAGKGGKALGETALSLGEEGVEGEGCLAGAADTCDDGQAVARYVDIDALEIVGLGLFYMDEFFFCLSHNLCLSYFEILAADSTPRVLRMDERILSSM